MGIKSASIANGDGANTTPTPLYSLFNWLQQLQQDGYIEAAHPVSLSSPSSCHDKTIYDGCQAVFLSYHGQW
jgi:hypothetical protein